MPPTTSSVGQRVLDSNVLLVANRALSPETFEPPLSVVFAPADLEVCLFNQLCKNGDDLFRLNQGDPFVCDLDPKRLRELEGILPAPREDDPYAERCEAWKLGRG